MDELDPAQRLILDALDEEYRRRHGAALEFLKAEVGEGVKYENAVARAVVSPNGAWFECKDLPMEFSGMAGGPAAHRFVSNGEALALLDRVYALTPAVTPENTRALGLFVIYGRTGLVDPRAAYTFDFSRRTDGPTRRPQSLGRYQPDVMPLFYRCRLDTDLDTTGLPIRRGVFFCLAHVSEKHLLVEMPYEGDRLYDLSDTPDNPVRQ